jgi:hypothetical protein
MPSVMGLLEERELGARQRVESLREEADRVSARLRDAEAAWERFVITRETMSEVLSSGDSVGSGATASPNAQDVAPAPERAGAVPRSTVPVWCEDLPVSALSPDYQRIMHILSGREHGGQDKALGCREITQAWGLELVAAKVEGVRSKANRLVARGWLVKDPGGCFRLTDALRGADS